MTPRQMRWIRWIGLAGFWTLLLSLGAFNLDGSAAYAFPPYKLTDADTADPWTLEARVGIVQYTVDRNEGAYSSPLLRLNLGLPAHTELLAEAEYSHETDRIEEAALGAKWIPWSGNPSAGFEALFLLPRSGEDRFGTEAALLMTLRGDPLLMHGNLGGFEDRRSGVPQSGWKGGVLVEWLRPEWRPGVELFAKQLESEPEQVSAGLGAIVPFDSIDFRFGGRVGLTEAAPDLTASIWISGKLPLKDL